MSFEIGDTVHTTSGKLYIVRSFWTSSRQGPSATLQPLPSSGHRKQTHAGLESLTLVRTAQLSLAYHYAALTDLPGIDEATRRRDAAHAARWLSAAEHRNDDSRAALCLGSDRILELEAVAP